MTFEEIRDTNGDIGLALDEPQHIAEDLPAEFQSPTLRRRALQTLAALGILGAIALLAPGLGAVRDELANADSQWLALAVLSEGLSFASYLIMFGPHSSGRTQDLASGLGVAPGDHDLVLARGSQAVARSGPAVGQPGYALDVGAAQERAEQLGLRLILDDLNRDKCVGAGHCRADLSNVAAL